MDLRPGDILLRIDEDPVIQFGQAIPKLKNKKLNNKAIHAKIWVQSPGSTEKRKEIAEAIPRGVESGPLSQGKYKVFRPLDKDLGGWAAQVALMWSDKPGEIPYSKSDAVLSIVRRSSYGSKAKKELNKYATDAFTNSPAWKNKGIFCSQFIIAAYQGAFQNISEAQATEKGEKRQKLAPPQGMLASRAKTTTPATLEYFLQNDKNFMFLGILDAPLELRQRHPVDITAMAQSIPKLKSAPIRQSIPEPKLEKRIDSSLVDQSIAEPEFEKMMDSSLVDQSIPEPKFEKRTDSSLVDQSIAEPEFEKMMDSSLEDLSITEPEFKRMI